MGGGLAVALSLDDATEFFGELPQVLQIFQEEAEHGGEQEPDLLSIPCASVSISAGN